MIMSRIPNNMRASVLTQAKTIELQERPVPQPDADEVLIRVASVGVCGSDVHFYEEGRLGDWVVTDPLVLGHEASGEIVAVGSDISSYRVGQRVSIEPQCSYPTSIESCRGEYNLDLNMLFYGVLSVAAALHDYVTIQLHFVYEIPDSMTNDAAALLDPLFVAIAAVCYAELSPAKCLFITGAVPIGFITPQVPRAFSV